MEGEAAELVHVVDVQPHHVAGDLALAELPRHLAHAVVGRVGIAALVVAQRPQRRQGHGAGQAAQGAHHVLRRVALDDDHRELRSLDEEADAEPEVDAAAVRSVGQHAEARAVGPHRQHPGVGLVEVGRARVPAVGVPVPGHDAGVVATQGAGHLAGAVEVGALGNRDLYDGAALEAREFGYDAPAVRRRPGRRKRFNQAERGQRRIAGGSRGVEADHIVADRLGHGLGGDDRRQQQQGPDHGQKTHSEHVNRPGWCCRHPSARINGCGILMRRDPTTRHHQPVEPP